MTIANRDQAEHSDSSEQTGRSGTHQDQFDRMPAPVARMILVAPLAIPDLGDHAAPGMFSLAEPGRIRSILAGSGWHRISVTPRRIPILVGGGTLDDAVTFLRTGPIGRRILDGADARTQARAIDSVRAAPARHADERGVHLDAAVWLRPARAPG